MGGGTRASERANSNDGNDNTENTDNTDNTKTTENAENTSSSSAPKKGVRPRKTSSAILDPAIPKAIAKRCAS